MKKTLLLLAAVLMSLSMMAQTTTYTKITSASQLVAGEQYILVGYDEALGYCAMSYQKTANRHAIQVVEMAGTITLAPATNASSETEAYEITVGGSNGAWTLYDGLKGGYLYAASSTANQLKTQTTLDDNGRWDIVFDSEGLAELTAQGSNTRNVMRFNENSSNGDPLFNCYNATSTINVKVAFYKAGATTIDPEPSEYPGGFTAAVDRTNVNLTWAASAGAQLPRGYVIIGSTGSINVPVDGTPVANDTDAHDGHVAYNVMYGETSFEFNGLTGNATWHFAIFPYTNSGSDIDYKTDGTYPTTDAVIGDIYGVLYANFAESLAPFTAYNAEGDQEWGTAVHSGITYALMNGYSSGATYANEDWLISPDLFANGTYETMTFSFKNAKKFEGNQLMVKIAPDYDGMSYPGEFDWTDITEEFQWSAGDYAWQESGEMVFEDIEASHFYIAFVYICDNVASSAWEITDVEVYGSGYDAVGESQAVSFNLYPNPASDMVRVNAESEAVVEIMDMAGRMVMNVNVNAGENTINVAELATGVYFVKMNGSVVKFVKR